MKINTALIFSILFLSFSSGCTDSKGKKEAINDSMNIADHLPDPLMAGWKGEPVCEVVEENENIRVLKCIFPPGVGHEKHYHNPHVGYTISGGLFRITSKSGTREVDAKTGSSFSNESITSHEVLNIGETTAEFLIIEYKYD